MHLDELKSQIISVRYEPDVSGYDFSETTECDFNSGFWKVENGQRSHILSALSEFDDKDLLMLSDVDEIPNSMVIDHLKSNPEKMVLEDSASTLMFDNLYYNFFTYENSDWPGTVFSYVKYAKKHGTDFLRHNSRSFPHIPNTGWHFTFFGGVDRIKDKLNSFSHQEFNTKEIN